MIGNFWQKPGPLAPCLDGEGRALGQVADTKEAAPKAPGNEKPVSRYLRLQERRDWKRAAEAGGSGRQIGWILEGSRDPQDQQLGMGKVLSPPVLQPIPAVTPTSACLPGETTVSVQTSCSTSHTRAKWQRGHCFPQSWEVQTCPPICVPLPLPQSHQEVLGKRGILCFPGQSPPYVDGTGG